MHPMPDYLEKLENLRASWVEDISRTEKLATEMESVRAHLKKGLQQIDVLEKVARETHRALQKQIDAERQAREEAEAKLAAAEVKLAAAQRYIEQMQEERLHMVRPHAPEEPGDAG